jgi:TIR domain
MTIQVFISHITEDATVAARLKLKLTEDFLGQLTVFQSSDTESIGAGEVWFSSLGDALRGSSVFIVLCSPRSIERPWVNFEAGAAWILKLPLIPVCFAGQRPGELPMPFSAHQALELADAPGLRRLYGRIAQILGFQLPARDYAELAADLIAPSGLTPADAEAAGLNTDKAIKSRIDEALNHPRFKWRSLDKVAAAAAIPADRAAAILQVDNRVRFGRGKTGNLIVGLRSRVD